MNVTQLVQVQILGAVRRYTYGWVFSPLEGGAPLKVGDKVVIPANQVQSEDTSATVVQLGSSYTGPVKSIIRKLSEEGGNPKVSAPEEDLWGGWGSGTYS